MINGQVLPRRPLRRLRLDEWSNDFEIRKRSEFDAQIKGKHVD